MTALKIHFSEKKVCGGGDVRLWRRWCKVVEGVVWVYGGGGVRLCRRRCKVVEGVMWVYGGGGVRLWRG